MPSVNIDGARIAYADNGSGDPVVLIHCSAASSAEWRSLSEALGEDFHAIAIDQWGCGESDAWPGHAAFSLAQEAAPVLRLIDSLATPVHLVGHSYGGGVALHVARRRPAMIRSLTLIEPSVFHLLRDGSPVERALFREIEDVAKTVNRATTSGDYWGGMACFLNYWSGDDAWRSMPRETRIRLGQRAAKIVLDFRALFEEPADLDDYAALEMPALIVCGERSPGPSRRIVEMLGGAMPRARIERIAGAGHMSPLTHADAVNGAICKHLRSMASAPRRRAA